MKLNNFKTLMFLFSILEHYVEFEAGLEVRYQLVKRLSLIILSVAFVDSNMQLYPQRFCNLTDIFFICGLGSMNSSPLEHCVGDSFGDMGIHLDTYWIWEWPIL